MDVKFPGCYAQTAVLCVGYLTVLSATGGKAKLTGRCSSPEGSSTESTWFKMSYNYPKKHIFVKNKKQLVFIWLEYFVWVSFACDAEYGIVF